MRSFAVLSLAALALAEPLTLEKRQAQCQNSVATACEQAASSLDLSPCINAACSSSCQSAVPQFKTCCANGAQADSVLNCLTSQAGAFGGVSSPEVSSAVSSVGAQVSSAVSSANAAASSAVAPLMTSAASVAASTTAAATQAGASSAAPSATHTGAAAVAAIDASFGLLAGIVGFALL